jgi:hypothetical protein
MVLYHPPDCIGFFQRDVSYQVGVLRLPSGDFTSSDEVAAQHLLMTHFPGCEPIEEHHSSGQVLQEPAQRLSARTFGTFKAAGEDGIFSGLLQPGI